ncbi:MAG: undecaprenyl-diphosphate phosphatase [Actinomycetes bacterium]|jgi:undecaprenyl-diphosphatase|nr:undecaprenyl-diphosphate phosphatase [Actinomycetes bacterium]
MTGLPASPWLYSACLGLAQGLTEFLPVSSSGHLSLLNLLFGVNGEEGLEFTFFLHIATLIAALIYFRRDIARLVRAWAPAHRHDMADRRRVGVFILIGCLVTGPMGLLLEDKLGAIADNYLFLGCAFLLTTIVLCVAEILTNRREEQERRAHHKAAAPVTSSNMGMLCAALTGFAQGCAVIPGFSRSGATIAGGMMVGLSRKEATRYSFLLGLPIIAAGAVKDGLGLLNGSLVLPPFGISLTGFIIAGVSGYLAIAVMLHFVQNTQLYWFAAYTAAVGIILIVISFIK